MTERERTAMTILTVTTLLAILYMLATTPAAIAQVRYGMLGNQPHELIAERYDPRDVKPAGFCIGRDVERKRFIGDNRDTFVIVHGAVPAVTMRVDTTWWVDSTSRDSTRQISESFLCPRGAANIHFHTFGNCNPSRTDYEALLEEGDEFGVIYCGVPRFFWREEAQAMLAPPLQVRHASIRDGPTGLPHDRGRSARRRDLYYASLTLGVGAVRVFKLDPVTEPDTRWRIQDQGFHLSAGFAIASAAIAADVRGRDAALGLCGATTALEYLKGEPSWRDVVGGCGGAALAWAWSRLVR